MLEHENALVHSSCTVSLTEAAEHWPEQVASIIRQLQDDFREKVHYIISDHDSCAYRISGKGHRTGIQ